MNNKKIEVIKSYLIKSNEKLTASKELFKSSLFNDSVSRCYYSVFHIISAVLFSKDLIYNSHKEIIGNFNREFIKTKIFPSDFYKKIRFLFDNRETGDYEIKKSIDEKTAELCLVYAEEIIFECKKYLSTVYKVDTEYWDKEND